MLKEIFEEIMNEKILNLYNKNEKEKYAEIVYDLLQKSYEKIGGLKGSGFENPQEMINKIYLWKIYKRGNKILAGIMYKDKGFRKAVAVFTNQTEEGKEALKKLLRDDFERSIIEISGPLYKFIENNFPTFLAKYKIPCKVAEKILGKKLDCIDDYFYVRNINGNKLEKIMVGTIKNIEK